MEEGRKTSGGGEGGTCYCTGVVGRGAKEGTCYAFYIKGRTGGT